MSSEYWPLILIQVACVLVNIPGMIEGRWVSYAAGLFCLVALGFTAMLAIS